MAERVVTDVPGSPGSASLRPCAHPGHALRRAAVGAEAAPSPGGRRSARGRLRRRSRAPSRRARAPLLRRGAGRGRGQGRRLRPARRRPSGLPARLRGGSAPVRDGAHAGRRGHGPLRVAARARRRPGEGRRHARGPAVVPRGRRPCRGARAARAARPGRARLRRQAPLGGLAGRYRSRAAARAGAGRARGRGQHAAGQAARPPCRRSASRRQLPARAKEVAQRGGARDGAPHRRPGDAGLRARRLHRGQPLARLHPHAGDAGNGADRRWRSRPATRSAPRRDTSIAPRP